MKSKFINGGKWIITARKRSLRRLCFHRCLSVHMEGVSLTETPLDREPPGTEDGNERTVRILLDCILVWDTRLCNVVMLQYNYSVFPSFFCCLVFSILWAMWAFL